MAHPWHHALSSARKFGGAPEDYIAIHNWFDATKASYGDFRHRALRHHAAGIFEMEKIFGVTMTNSAGKVIPTRFIGEQHVREDCGGIIPSAQDWLRGIAHKPWMTASRLSKDMIRLPEGEELDLSVEAWRAAVAAGETTLGHIDWATRLPMTVIEPNEDSPVDGMGAPEEDHMRTKPVR